MADLDYILRVLRVTAAADMKGELGWTVDGAGVRFWINCSDVFDWGTADCEALTPENVAELERAIADCKGAGDRGCIYASWLFAARMRRLRPQGASYPDAKYAALWPLFDACGPEREVGIGNPRKHPALGKPPDSRE